MNPHTAPQTERSVHRATPSYLTPPVVRRAVAFDREEPEAGAPARREVRRSTIVIVIVIAFAAFTVSAIFDFLLGQIAVPVLTIAGLHGLSRGGFRKLLVLPVTVGAAYLAASHLTIADSTIRKVTSDFAPVADVMAGALAVAIVLAIAGRLADALYNRFFPRRPALEFLDHLAGAGTGLIEGAFFLLVLCWATAFLEPQARVVLEHRNAEKDSLRNQFAAGLVQLTEEINGTNLERVVHETNLLEEIPAVRDVLSTFAKQAIDKLEAQEGPSTARPAKKRRGTRGAQFRR